MSNNNPYAVNGYGGANPYDAPNPYVLNATVNDPYLPQNNGPNPSISSYGSRPGGERRPTNTGPSPANPFGRAPPPRRDLRDEQNRSPMPQSLGSPYDTSSPPLRSPGYGYAQGDSLPTRTGYGGLGLPEPDYERRQGSYSRPDTAGQDRDPRDFERDRLSSDGRNRDRRAASDAREMPYPLNRPPIPSTNPGRQLPPNGTYGTYGAGRPYSPRRPDKSMDEILRHIQNSWRIMEGDECVPVKVALQLADPSSLGLADKEPDFAETHVDLQKSLKAVVNEHYADFNSAVGTYHKIQASIRESQSRVRYLKTGLATVKGSMLTTRPELRELAEQSGQLDDLLLVVSQMESLRELPAKLEEKINEKRWIGAVDILGEALISCRKKELDEIGAMSDLRVYFTSQESSLVDMLIEELHDHLYLKSPYCSQRWKGRKVNGGESNARDSFGGNAWDRPVYHFLASLDTKQPMAEDASKNPESDTFYYMQMIVEALHRRGYLEELVTRIEQRMPVELYKIVERTHQEVDAKYPNHLRNTMNKSKTISSGLQTSETDTKILSDLLWTLYAKFEAIAEGHRVMHEVVLGITEREKIAKPEKYGSSFKELWKLYQMEIRSLLHDYLATDGDIGLAGGKHSIVAGDVFSKLPRDKGKRMFKLSEMDQKSSDIRVEEDELDEILKSSVPGLVTKSKVDEESNALSSRGDLDGTAAGHKLLIEPSVFNMTVLLPPSLVFLQHLKDIVPTTSKIAMSTLTSFLDDFLINVFHPQLEEAVTDMCTESMLDYEAFMEDPQWAKHSPHPIFKGTVDFMSLVHAFSKMLSQIPSDQMFTQLIITQLYKYYDRCYGFYKNIVSRVSQANQASGVVTTVMKAAAGHAEEGDIRETTVPLWTNREMDRAARTDLMKKEVNLLIAAAKTNPIQAYDIISDPKSIHQLSLIYNSMQWLSASLDQLRNARPKSIKSHSRNTSLTGPLNPRRWTLITSLTTGIDTDALNQQENPIYLPLTKETKVPFNETLTSFRSLASKALLTLHLDIRCGIIHQLTKNLKPHIPTNDNTIPPQAPGMNTPTTGPTRESTPPPLDSGVYPFVLSAPPTSASPMVLELNNDLIHFDASISSYLGPRERLFILRGLGRLVDRYLVVGADHVQVMNQHGAERMRVDGMVVQQVLRGLGVTASLGLNSSSTNGTKSPPTSPHRTRTNTNSGLGITSPPIPTPGSPLSPAPSTSTSKDNSKIPITLTPTTPAAISSAKIPISDPEEEDALLLSSSQYYTLFLAGSDAIMAFVKMKKAAALGRKGDIGYSYDEFRTLIELVFSAAIRGEDREESVRARKRMGDVLLGLGEVMWDS